MPKCLQISKTIMIFNNICVYENDFFLCKIGPLNVVLPYPCGLWIWQIWIFTIWNCFHTRFSFSAQFFFSFICLLFYRFFSTHPFVKTRSAIAIHPITGYYDLNKLSDDTLRNKLQFFWPTVFWEDDLYIPI